MANSLRWFALAILPVLLCWLAFNITNNMPSHRKIIIVGSGAAGMTAALELTRDPTIQITLIEKGKLSSLSYSLATPN
jgi:hypothetical protein